MEDLLSRMTLEEKVLQMSQITLGKNLNAPLGLTWSCYGGGDKACGRCDSCRLRLKGFEGAGFKDEIEYE